MQHRIENLCYQLVQGQVCLEPLRILARREMVWNGWHVAFYVLGASHAVVLEKGGICITELFTCAPVTSAVPVLAQSEGKLPMLLCPDVPNFRCRVRLERFPLAEENALLAEENRLRLDVAQGDTLVFTFPHAANEIAPVTRVGWQAVGDVLRIETIHTYPEEHCGVRSETVLQAIADLQVTAGEQRSQFHAIEAL